MADPGPAPKLDYRRPEPRKRPAWADMLLALLTGFALLAATSLPIIVFKLLIPLSDKSVCVIYACLGVVMVVVMPRVLKAIKRI